MDETSGSYLCMDPDQETINLMQTELCAMIAAWADRGVDPADSAMFLMGVAHKLTMELTDCTLPQMLEAITEQWSAYGGK